MSPGLPASSPSLVSAPDLVLQLPKGLAQVFRRAEEVPAELWTETFGGTHKDRDYYRLIEATMREHFVYRYVVLTTEDHDPIALQPLIITEQDLAASAGPAIRRTIRRVRSVFPRFLRTRLLMAGCLVGDGHLGVRPGSERADAAGMMADALTSFARSEAISLIVVKDFPVSDRTALRALLAAGYVRLDSYPGLWTNLEVDGFEAYMEQRLSKITRKGLRRKLRKAAEAEPPITLEVLEDCTDVIDEIYPLYLAVAERSQVTFETFTRDYFLEAGRAMPGRFRYFIWRQAGKAVAFSFCTVYADSIYDNDIGLDYSVAYDLNLYYVTFRDLIEWAVTQRLKYYHSAPFNYDAKLHLRLQLVPLDLYVRHRSALLNWLIRLVGPHFAPAKTDPVLRRVPAA